MYGFLLPILVKSVVYMELEKTKGLLGKTKTPLDNYSNVRIM